MGILLSIIVILVVSIPSGLFFIAKKYFGKKFENLATIQDTKAITEIVEGI